ncbi:hypothetical protein [Dyadobacter frigoris]|uniref:Neutral/alkaline non-lysosomal ceramidase N-terminal domain-containing protein n=1 Tax=Dyadobacter frigoris TaxID=2576211 RepID=A0A4U6D4I5_9BACT|nr:hypothetical protein [Dyadobacter frigoris]TKT92219.1 hypothetical protein FDK13_09530 [Dyadobacter frigoris]GLU53393.1 hypothetical protein Dfri01_28540 [Dyadobacter frigoris]
MIKKTILLFPLLILVFKISAQSVRVGVFYANVTPLIGSPVAYSAVRSIQDSLSARGIVILSEEKPVVICAVDWIGISNEGQDLFKNALAKAAGTTSDRVSIHALHQHDGPASDFTIAKILADYGLGGVYFDNSFLYRTIDQVAKAVKYAKENARPVSHVGFGEAKVEKVASTRRVMGADGKVAFVRWSSATDSASMTAPEGLIDPLLKSVSFWNGNIPLVVLSFYATHPQSHYGKGDVSCEFVGIARNERQKKMHGVPNIYLTGASGNVAAGKYNNGADTTRYVLAGRIETAMQNAWIATKKKPVRMSDLSWKSIQVSLPLGQNIVEKDLRAILSDPKMLPLDKYGAAEKLAWLLRTQQGFKASVSALRIGNVWLLNLPGECFVEYQLAAQKMKPGGHVCTAAYDEYGPGYIGTKLSYAQGGYETSDLNSGVSGDAEAVLMNAISEVLK